MPGGIIGPVALPTKQIGLGLVMTCLATTLSLGIAMKVPCAGGDWGDGRQYRSYCYSDIVPLHGTEQLTG